MVEPALPSGMPTTIATFFAWYSGFFKADQCSVVQHPLKVGTNAAFDVSWMD